MHRQRKSKIKISTVRPLEERVAEIKRMDFAQQFVDSEWFFEGSSTESVSRVLHFVHALRTVTTTSKGVAEGFC